MAGDTQTPSSPQNKRQKTLKSKIEEDSIPQEPDNSSSRRCSICFLDDGKAIRGEIDCCDHYFCFLCITEWSKIESRCPLCRRRFSTILRQPKDGVFSRERVVKVPVCDQAHHPSSNATRQLLPYEDVTCQVCRGMADESLLLLCDICDSAAHTYCVGLGNTVPEGDWFCLDCTTIGREHHDDVDSDSESDDEYLLGPSDPNISAFGIVRESNSHSSVANRYLARILRIPNSFTPPVVPDRSTSIADEVTTPAKTLPSVAAAGARTLVHCRYVCDRVQELRENWNAIQSGSLSFSSSSFKSGCSSSQKPNNGVVIHERSGQTQSSSSTSGQQQGNRDSSGSNDIDKAWRMMEIAKSRMDAGKKCSSAVQSSTTSDSRKRTNVNSCFGTSSQAQSSSSAGCHRPTNQFGFGTRDIESKQHVHTNTGSSSGVQHPKILSRISSASKEATNVTSSFDILRNQQRAACNRTKTGEEAYKCSSREKETIRHQSVKLEKDRQFRVKTQDAVGSSKGPSTKHIKQAAENIIHEQNRSACSVNGASSSFYVEGQSRKDAKSEIASVVKMNLMMLTKDKPLEVDAFKEIARLSTHTIYGACGLKHSKYGMYSFPSLECPHTEQFQPPHKPSPMPNSCRACFDGFVKGVVSSVLCGSAGSAKLSRAPS